MNKSQRQVIAEKVSSTVRVLELLDFDYRVLDPRKQKQSGNKSPRVVYVDVGKSKPLRVYNSATGSTWANESNGKPISEIKTIEDLYLYLKKTYRT